MSKKTSDKNSDLEFDEISKAFNNPERMKDILQEGIFAALAEHKRAGNPVCEWRDGNVVWIPPEEIPTGKK